MPLLTLQLAQDANVTVTLINALLEQVKNKITKLHIFLFNLVKTILIFIQIFFLFEKTKKYFTHEKNNNKICIFIGLNGERSWVCECKHYTDGQDCEKCLPFYNDAPWGRATSKNVHECKRK